MKKSISRWLFSRQKTVERRKVWKRLTATIVVTLLIGLIVPTLVTTAEATAPSAANNQFIIFVHGLRTPWPISNDTCGLRNVVTDIGSETFGVIRATLQDKTAYPIPASNFYYFSYNVANSQADTCGDTYKSLYDHVVTMNALVNRILAKNSNPSITIITHSLGGAVATNWISSTNFDYRKYVKSIITIDSPLRGRGFVNYLSGISLGTIPVIIDLDPTNTNATSTRANSVYATNVFNIGNLQDTVVPAGDSYLDGTAKFEINDSRGHGAGLVNTNVLDYIKQVVATNYLRPNLPNSAGLKLNGSWGSWSQPWLFGRRSYETGATGANASLTVPTGNRYVGVRTSTDRGRGTAQVFVDDRQVQSLSLYTSSYHDVTLCYDLGNRSTPANFKIQLAGGGNLNVNTILISNYLTPWFGNSSEGQNCNPVNAGYNLPRLLQRSLLARFQLATSALNILLTKI